MEIAGGSSLLPTGIFMAFEVIIPIWDSMCYTHSRTDSGRNCRRYGCKELYDELVGVATKYASFRSRWFLWDRATRMEHDDRRTSCHNSLIVKFDMLARYLKSQNKDAEWRETLGYEKDDRYNRKAIGDFACYLVFVNSINAR